MPESPIEELEEEIINTEDTDDGGAIIQLGEEGAPEENSTDFYDNIVEKFPESELAILASNLLEEVERDKQSRLKRDKQYEEAIQRTGLGKETPGGADFEGASKAVHPMLTEACIDFSARTIQELLPAKGPVKTFVPGDRPPADRVKKAERKKEYMNWQFLVQMPDFRTELEQLLTQLPLGGSQYMRLVWDSKKKRPVPIFVPIDHVYLPYAASNFYTAERITYAESITRLEFEQRVGAGMYIDLAEGTSSPQVPDPSDPQKATDRIEGRDTNLGSYNEDGLRVVLEISVYLSLEDDLDRAPYLVTIDESSQRVISLVRNWEEGDETLESMFWMVEFPFVPWRGAYSIGLGQIIGSLSGAATGALRALLDSAHINNIPTLLKLKGSNFSGQSKELNIAEVTEIEGGVASDDIRKLLMPVPFNQPSPVLFELLGFLVNAGQGVIRTTFDRLADQNPNIPVGTTLALIEEGMKVMSAIYGRLYHALDRVFRILHRINRLYLEDEEVKDDIGEMLAYRRDFELPLDVIPVANPEVFSDVQRMSQLQVVADRAAQFPQIYDLRKIEKRILEQTKVPNPDEFLLPVDKPESQNAVNENAAMTLGRPVAAFPEQDHLAHLQVHLDYLTSPMLGGLIIIAPTFIPMCLDHIKEHLALWYVTEISDTLQRETSKDDAQMKQLLSFRDSETRQELDRTLAAISQNVTPTATEKFQQIPEIIQQAMQMMDSLKPQPEIPLDPNQQAAIQAQTQIEQLKVQGKQQSDQQSLMAKQQLEQMKLAAGQQSDERQRQHEKEKEFMNLNADQQKEAARIAGEQARQATEFAARLEELRIREQADDQRTAAEMASREKINAEDNQTALRIAAAEIISGEKVAVESGTGINPDPSD